MDANSFISQSNPLAASQVDGAGNSNSLNNVTRSMYKEVALFNHQLAECRFIGEIVDQNVFIPTGFN